MTTSLRPVAAFAGHLLSDAELEQVQGLLADYLEEVRKLRALDLPDDIEPVTHLRMERWE